MAENLKKLIEERSYLSARPSKDWLAVNCAQENVFEFLKELKETFGYDLLTDVTAIDHYEVSPRFEVVYHLFHREEAEYIRVATPCANDLEPVCASIVELWPAANWHERETYDMFGIIFDGHPDLRRILMWDSYPFFPLRKEFPLAGEEVELPAPDVVERTGVKVKPAPMMGGPFHSSQKGSMVKREPRADDESWNESNERSEIERPGKPREFKESN